MAVLHFLRTFNVPLFVPLPNFIRGHFVNFSTRRNKSLNIGHLSIAVKMGRSTAASFQVFLCQYYVYKFTIWNVIDVLAQSSISSFHCGHLSPSCNSIWLAFIFILLFSHAHHATIVFAAWVAVPFFASLHHFNSRPPMPFSLLPSILSLFSQQLSLLFIQG